jgi:MEMO1 family protein
MIREPVVAGQFYAATRDRLREELDKAFRHVGEMARRHTRSIVSPHAGYMFSGSCAAHGYRALKASGNFDAFIILGFSHAGIGSADCMMSGLDWKTPLGIATLNQPLTKALLSVGIIIDERPHEGEHSIEVQLPFLQYLFGQVSFVPIAVAQEIDYAAFGSAIARVIKGSKLSVGIIASSDFTHYGPGYGYVPFDTRIPEQLRRLDLGAVDHIIRLDSSGLLSYIQKTGSTICGASPIALQIEIMKAQKTKSVELLKYSTSGELTGDYSHSVSYASIAFDR